jgi:murein DD-endopeptidase MepM/ murein hydrolase activator NlpD
VKQGDLLGLSGVTGRVTGPHLHWQTVIHKQKVNPMGLIEVLK